MVFKNNNNNDDEDDDDDNNNINAFLINIMNKYIFYLHCHPYCHSENIVMIIHVNPIFKYAYK